MHVTKKSIALCFYEWIFLSFLFMELYELPKIMTVCYEIILIYQSLFRIILHDIIYFQIRFINLRNKLLSFVNLIQFQFECILYLRLTEILDRNVLICDPSTARDMAIQIIEEYASVIFLVFVLNAAAVALVLGFVGEDVAASTFYSLQLHSLVRKNFGRNRLNAFSFEFRCKAEIRMLCVKIALISHTISIIFFYRLFESLVNQLIKHIGLPLLFFLLH